MPTTDRHRRPVPDRPGPRRPARRQAAVADLDGVHVATPMSPELSSGIVCIEIDGVQPFGVLAGLLERGFSTGITPYRNNYLRIGPSIVTTPDETEALVEAIADLA
jgi:selenocysteine lyase/cysteine desulfurase